MQVTLTSEEDIKCMNWSAVADQIGKQAREKIVEVMNRAATEIRELEPGEKRKLTIEIGTIEISREMESKT